MEEAIKWLQTSLPHYAVVLAAFPVCVKIFAWVEDQLSANAKHEVTDWLKSFAKYASGARQFDLLRFHSKLFGDNSFDRTRLRRTLFFSFLAYSFILLPSTYISLTTAGKAAADIWVELCFSFGLFIIVIFPLDFCGIIMTRRLSALAGNKFTVQRSCFIFASDLIIKTIVFPIAFLIFIFFSIILFLSISGLLWNFLHALIPHWLEAAFRKEPSSLLEMLESLNTGLNSLSQDQALMDAFEEQPHQDLSKILLYTYLSLLPSVAICSAWVWLYAIALYLVRASVFLFDVDTKPVRSTGIVAALILTLLLGAYTSYASYIRLYTDNNNNCASSSYYMILTLMRSDRSLDEAIALCPKYSIAYYLRAARYSAARENDRAIADYSEAILLGSHPFHPLLERADAYLTKNNYDLAIGDYSEAIKAGTLLQETRPTLKNLFPYIFFRRGSAYANKEEYGRAIEDYTEAIRLAGAKGAEPDYDYYKMRADAYEHINNYNNAISDYTEAAKLVSEYNTLLAGVLYRRAQAYVAKGEFDLGISDFDRSLELDLDKKTLYLRGRAHAANGSYEKSIADYDRTIELDPAHPYAVYSRAVSRERQRDYTRAIADFRQAVTSDPENAYAVLWLFLVRAQFEPAAAAEELAVNTTRLLPRKWPYPIVELMLGLRTLDSTLAEASSSEQSCDAHFFLARWRLLQGDQPTATRFLTLAEGECSKQSTMYIVSRDENKQRRP